MYYVPYSLDSGMEDAVSRQRDGGFLRWTAGWRMAMDVRRSALNVWFDAPTFVLADEGAGSSLSG